MPRPTLGLSGTAPRQTPQNTTSLPLPASASSSSSNVSGHLANSDMVRRGKNAQGGGVIGNMFSQSPVSREPLLSSAQGPGMSQRLSESSLASFDQPHMTNRAGNTSSFSSYASATNRYGPSAALSPTAARAPPQSNPTIGAPLTSGMEDDDDLDDALHTFTAADKKSLTPPFDITSWRGWANGLMLAFLALAVVMLFAGYPILSYYLSNNNSSGSNTSGYNLGGVNSSGQYPSITNLPSLIDADTPTDVYTRTGFDGETWALTFSDEFNKDGRTFYDGDDPFFQAVDIHYWPTGDFEWYDPSAAYTENGHLVLRMDQESIHDLNFKSAMIQSWNKLCFNKNAYFELSLSLPGTSTVGGFWPGIWTMGNLGRPGYGATTEGLWPYSYDSCDIGTLANQTWVNGTGPDATLTTGADGGPLSYLPGQRYSACTCEGEDHPGPSNNIGRASPEIDLIEAQIIIDEATGEVSQSAQFAPYDDYYQFYNTTDDYYEQYNTTVTSWNSYLGGYYQQAVSSLSKVPNDIYYNQDNLGETSKQFAVFGFEYSSDSSDRSKGYITWVSNGVKSWTMKAGIVGPNSKTEVGQRIVSEEPMALIFNLGMSNNFQNVDFSHMVFPNYLRIDYIRVWQRSDGTIGCDPDDHPTADFIAKYADVYANPNLTTWAGAGYSFPKNSLKDSC